MFVVYVDVDVEFGSYRNIRGMQAEQKAVYGSNGDGERSLTWSQTRKMPFTNKVYIVLREVLDLLSLHLHAKNYIEITSF